MKPGEPGYLRSLRESTERMERDYCEMVRQLCAADFAVMAHGDQKYGDRPYLDHLHEVRCILGEHEFRGPILAAAWLHDVLEDTNISRSHLQEWFGAQVSNMVWAVTGIGKNRKERNASVYEKIGTVEGAADLKLADRIANLSQCIENDPVRLRMYVNEHHDFRAAMVKHCQSRIRQNYDFLVDRSKETLVRTGQQ